nr:MAG TPA: hypothetical protein [Inoviridae sp.]
MLALFPFSWLPDSSPPAPPPPRKRGMRHGRVGRRIYDFIKS